MVARCSGGLLLCLPLSFACNYGPDGIGGGGPVVFPWQGYVGDGAGDRGSTAAIVIDSNYIPNGDLFERYDLTRDRVAIFLQDPDPGTAPNWALEPVFLRSVSNIRPTPPSQTQLNQPGISTTVALFDLPTPAVLVGLQSAVDAELRVEVDGVVAWVGEITILDNGGEPTVLFDPLLDPNFESSLETKRVIRLSAQRASFLDGWMIGGLKFEFQYAFFCIDGIRAYPASEGHLATVAVGAPTQLDPVTKKVDMMMVDPQGFQLGHLSGESNIDTDKAGQGPVIDIGVANSFCGGLTEASFEIHNLLVTDIDGGILLEESGETSAFSYAIVDPSS